MFIIKGKGALAEVLIKKLFCKEGEILPGVFNNK